MAREGIAIIPHTGWLDLVTYDKTTGQQRVSLRYDLTKRGNRQAVWRYYQNEKTAGHAATLTHHQRLA